MSFLRPATHKRVSTAPFICSPPGSLAAAPDWPTRQQRFLERTHLPRCPLQKPPAAVPPLPAAARLHGAAPPHTASALCCRPSPAQRGTLQPQSHLVIIVFLQFQRYVQQSASPEDAHCSNNGVTCMQVLMRLNETFVTYVSLNTIKQAGAGLNNNRLVYVCCTPPWTHRASTGVPCCNLAASRGTSQYQQPKAIVQHAPCPSCHMQGLACPQSSH